MLENLRHYSVYLILLSTIVGVVFWYKLPNWKSRLFLFSIFFSFSIDFLGKYFTEWTGLLNYGIYNFYILLLFSYYILFFKSVLKSISYRNIANIFLFVFIIITILNWGFWQNGLERILTYTYAFGVIFITILSVFYLLELFSSNLITNFTKSIYFWYIIGILIFHLPFLPFMLSLQWFLIDFNPTVYGIILFFLNLLMSTSFIIGFVWSEKRYNY